MEALRTRAARASHPRPVKRRAACVPLDKEASLSDEVSDYNLPLRPLRDHLHADRYQAIDGFNEQFARFRKVFDRPDAWQARGHLFVVTGDRGFGKTSLRQRCAYWMREEMRKEWKHPDCEVVVVDLSDEDWSSATSDLRLTLILDRVLDDLRYFLYKEDLSLIKGRPHIEDSFQKLDSLLKWRVGADGTRKPVVTVVLPPGYPDIKDIKQYYKLIREGMVFIVEIFSQDDIKAITENIDRRRDPFVLGRVNAHVMRLGELKRGDDKLLAQRLQKDLGNCPSLNNTETWNELGRLLNAGREVSASQMMKALTGAVKIAIEEGSGVVTGDHVKSFFALTYLDIRD